MNINSYLLPIGGAVLGYLVGDEETAIRNAAIGAGVGLAANYFMKPSAPVLEEDLPPQSTDIVPVEDGGPAPEIPDEPQQESPTGEPDYASDSGADSDWIGKDPFPVGAVARFAVPLQTSEGVAANFAVKTENGNWVSQPGSEMYWISIGSLARDSRVRILDVVDQSESTSFWSPSDPQPLSTYP